MAAAARSAARTATWVISIALAAAGAAWCVDRAYVQPGRQGYVVVALLLGVLGVGWGLWRGQRAVAAAALSRSEARFERLIEAANDPILVLARDGRILLANPRAAALYGRTAAELVSITDDELRPPETRAEIPRDRDRIDAAGGLVFETEHVRADGTRVPVEISSSPLERGGEHVYLAIVRDATVRKAADAALRASEERERARAADIETILDALPLAVVITRDAACTDVRGNRFACAQFGLPPRASLSIPPGARTPFRSAADGREIPREELPLYVSASRGVEVNGTEMDVARADGTLRRVLGNSRPLLGPDGAPIGAVAAFVDLTEHRRTQREVEVLRRAIEQAQVSVVITDAAGDIEYVNPKFCSLTGHTAADVVGENLRLLKSGTTPPEVYADLWRRITTGRVWTGELQNRRKDGTLYWESAVISPILDESGRTTHFVAVKEDVTVRREQEAALRAAQGDLLQAQKMEAVGRLAGGVAHDFNNILGVIMGYTELTLARFAHDDPRRRGLQEVLDAAERAAGLTRQLLAFSRKQVIEPRVLDLNAVVTATTRMLRRLVGEDVALDVRLDPALGRVRADAGQIEQVLMNLVVNARDAMPRGGRIEIGTRNVDVATAGPPHPPELLAGRWVVVSIRDTGVGVPKEIRDRIFEPFFTTKDAGKGTGLGLPTVYGIAQQSGGFVRFDSQIGQGTVFEVALPRWEGPEDAPLAARSVPPAAAAGTILLVEDEPVLRALARSLLVDAGYEVLTAENANGAIAIAMTHDGPIDLLFTDVVMPGAPGPDLAERLTGRIAGNRVLYMSGYTEHPMLRGAEIRPGTRLLRKPFTGDALRRAVSSALSD